MTNDYSPLEVDFDYLPVLNFAMQQNNIPVIRRFSVKNNTPEVIRKLKISLIPEPAFFHAEPAFIEVIDPEEIVVLEKVKIHLVPEFLAQLTERVSGFFRMEIEWGGEVQISTVYPVEILAFDEWGGSSVLPEMLTSFITPNHPAIPVILGRASELLDKWTGSPSLDEYQRRDPDRVKKQMAAIYTALTEQQIVYITPPASFESKGQRVRLTDTVLQHKMGTCLDMALLYASCMEAAGIHPLIVVIHGHAFAGGWLLEEIFPDSIMDDVASLSKRVADGINEIVLVETTCINKGNGSGFDDAARLAFAHIRNEYTYMYTLDVKRARLGGIKPLPQRIRIGDSWEIKEASLSQKKMKYTNPYELKPIDLSVVGEDVQITKQLIWERKLLDLSLRNNLLNLRITKSTLQLISADPACFEDALADGKEFRILPMFGDWDDSMYQQELNQFIHLNGHAETMFRELLDQELNLHRLRSFLPDTSLKIALQHLYRASRLSMEENGANTLYLALGFLKWFETPSSVRPRYAPILLLPVEIIRKPAAGGYVVRSREEETLMNITLLEMLRQNFGIVIPGLDPLPVDDSGVHVKLIYSIIRSRIKDQPRWDVEEQAVLGIFSFNKFIMWNDIHNNASKLVKNNIVYSLMNGVLDWEAEEMQADAAELDRTLGPSDILLPISADSSQLESIYEAVEGKSFILHGPPGTGKSQTITNIIANALYKGKRVLFVAEKMAALSVVQARLAALGLDPFCLELHSNKAKKSMVMERLKRTTEIIRHKSPEYFVSEAEQLNALRSQLNEYVEVLHKRYPFGLSLYEAIVGYLSNNQTLVISFPPSLFDGLTHGKYRQWEELVQELMSIGTTFGHPHAHPLAGIYISAYSNSLKEEGIDSLEGAIDVLQKLKEKQHVFSLLFGEGASVTYRQLSLASSLIDILLRIPELTSALLQAPSLHEVLDEYREVVTHGKERNRLRNEIEKTYSSEILKVPATNWLSEWNRYQQQWFLPRYFGQKKILKNLRGYLLHGRIDKQEIPTQLKTIIQYQEKEKLMEPYKYELTTYFGKAGRSPEDWHTISGIIEDTTQLNQLIFAYASVLQEATDIKDVLSRQVRQGIYSFRQIYGEPLKEVQTLLNSLDLYNIRLKDLLGIDPGTLYNGVEDWAGTAITKLNTWRTHMDKLKDWYQWLRIEDRMKEQEISFVAESYLKEQLPTEQMVDIFRRSYRKGVIEYIFNCNPQLELFNGTLFETVIRRYRDMAKDFEDLSRKELYARLASCIPSFTREASQNSEVGILQKNIRNNARGMSIRRLFDQIPTLLQRLSPCMLMSPISVAQYIDPDAEPFDLVIFDEASQMPTYEAVGAIARGKHMIIVGDPKQMPPTSFFMTNTVDEENMEMEDLESILDDCLALSMPSKHLLWHYRSKHESLIAFSNSEYYENKLLTFPSPDNLESKVKMVKVDGFYDKGKSRLNRKEAKAVVDEIVRRLSDKELRKRSIGVVTFSSVQQNLIEDLLAEVYESDPQLEQLALGPEEPLFVKNLENVQGDERDIILFSVGYGPDAQGKVSMNFGPLNRNGGERRLNVAVSRARYEMILFSTLTGDMIDLNRTSATGVAGLKRFLEFAEKGKGNYTERHYHEGDSMSIGELIAIELRKTGYTVHTNIGCSGYRIDLAVVDENCPSRYMVGVLCDGENYNNGKTARDREIVRTAVLKQLGWNLHRVWTLDWLEKPETVLEKIRETIWNVQQEIKEAEEIKEPETEDLAETALEPETELDQTEVKSDDKILYTLANLPIVATSEEFFLPQNRLKILSQMNKVLQKEAPISRNLMFKRIMQAWGINRLTQRVEAQMEDYLSTVSPYISKHEEISFLWLDEEQCHTYSFYRPDSGRDATDLPAEEVANGVKRILQDQIGLPMGDLVKITGQLFGFARCGTNVEAAMMRGIREAANRNFVKFNNGQIVIK